MEWCHGTKYTTVLRLRMMPEEHQAAVKLAALHHEALM